MARLRVRTVHLPAPGADSGKIRLLRADLLQYLQDLLDKQPLHVQQAWTVEKLLADLSIRKGEHLTCMVAVELPTARWVTSFHPDGYIQIEGKQDQKPFGTYDRGAEICRGPPGVSPTYRGAAVSATGTRVCRRPRAARTTQKPEFEYSSPPSSPGHGNAPYRVHLHRWGALAVSVAGQTNPLKDAVLHACSEPACACLAHFRPGTDRCNRSDREWHASHPECAPRRYNKLQ